MSKFDDTLKSVMEAVAPIVTAPVYRLSPEFDAEALTGLDQVVANFVDAKPASQDEIIDLIQQSDETVDRKTATEIARNLIDTGILLPAVEEPVDNEPEVADLSNEPEPEVNVNEPIIAPIQHEEDDEEEDKTEVPHPSEDDDEEHTFVQRALKPSIDQSTDDEEEDQLEDNDDTPISELMKREENGMRKQKQRENLLRYLYAKRGRTPEEIEQAVTDARAKGLI